MKLNRIIGMHDQVSLLFKQTRLKDVLSLKLDKSNFLPAAKFWKHKENMRVKGAKYVQQLR
jgi:hypothetical protein